MTNKVAEKRRKQVRNLIEPCKEIVRNFDENGVLPKISVINNLKRKVLDQIDFIEHWIDNYKLSITERTPRQEKIDYLNMIKEREKDLEELRKCLSSLMRIH